MYFENSSYVLRKLTTLDSQIFDILNLICVKKLAKWRKPFLILKFHIVSYTFKIVLKRELQFF